MMLALARITLIPILCCSGCLLACGGGFHHLSSPDQESIYTRFGPPDKVETGPNPRPADEGEATSYPYEDWHYGHVDGMDHDVVLEFVDKCLCGDYRLNLEPSALLRD
jgi:hypothetical protein